MPTFTFLPQTDEAVPAQADAYTVELPSAEAAMTVARERLLATGADRASIAIGEGDGTNVGWLGVWDYVRGAEPVWSPDD